MKNLLSFSNPSLSSKGLWVIMTLALIGLVDSTYLATTHYLGQDVACSVIKGCELVLTSKYATVFGVPIAVGGIIYYGTIFLCLYYFKVSGDSRFLKAFTLALATGAIATAYFLYLQFAVIGAICQYCMISAFATTIMVLVAAMELRNKKQQI